MSNASNPITAIAMKRERCCASMVVVLMLLEQPMLS
jgi:hypothetical protein